MRKFNRRTVLKSSAAAIATAAVIRRANAAEFSLKYGNDLPAAHPINTRAREAVDAIKAATNGRLDLVVPALTRALRDPNPSVRGNSASALGQIGGAAKPAVPELLRLLQDTNNYPRLRSMEMLLKIDPEAAAKAAGK